MNFTNAGLDCCPAPTKLAPELVAIKGAIGCVYASIYRGEDPNAAKYFVGGSAACGDKHTQAWIYAHYPPGVANPPGFSTHELKNDGVAYTQWLRGASLPWWCCGIDVDDAHVAAFCAEARKRGWIVTITYPTSPVEHHHVNFRKAPKILDLVPVLKFGSKGVRVKRLQKQLAFIERPNKPGVKYLSEKDISGTFSHATETAVKLFQADHHQAADGAVGKHTRAQLKVSVRREKVRHKIDNLKIKLHNAEDAVKKARTPAQREQQKKRAAHIEKEIRHLGGKP